MTGSPLTGGPSKSTSALWWLLAKQLGGRAATYYETLVLFTMSTTRDCRLQPSDIRVFSYLGSRSRRRRRSMSRCWLSRNTGRLLSLRRALRHFASIASFPACAGKACWGFDLWGFGVHGPNYGAFFVGMSIWGASAIFRVQIGLGRIDKTKIHFRVCILLMPEVLNMYSSTIDR